MTSPRPRTAAPPPVVFFLCACVWGFAACAPRRPPPAAPPAPAPAAPGVPTAQELLARVEAVRAQRESLRGLARVVYAGGAEKGTVRQAVAVAAPDRFRVELFSPVGIVSLIATDGQTLAAYLPRDKVIYRGAARPDNVERFIRVLLSASEVAGLLLGVPVIPEQVESSTVQTVPDRDAYRLIFSLPGGGRQEFSFDQRTRQLTGWAKVNADCATLARVTLGGYRKVNGVEFPFEVVLSDVQGGQEAAVYYESLELNPPLPDTLFQLAPIPGVQETDLDTPPP